MKKETLQETEINAYISEFKIAFHEKFGMIPNVKYSFVKPTALSLYRVEILANKLLKTMDPDDRCMYGVRTKQRYKKLVLVRHCMFKLTRDMGYSATYICKHFEFTHATILHSCRIVNDLVRTNDTELITVLKQLSDAIQEEYRNDGDVPTHDRSGLIS